MKLKMATFAIALITASVQGQLQFCNSSTNLPSGTVGQPYNPGMNATICADGASGIRYSESGNFPSWSVVQDLPAIDGTPTTATTYHFTITLTDAVNQSTNKSFSLTINPQPLPSVQTLAASSIAVNSATLNSSVNPNGASTTIYFQYGLTAGYGNMTSSENIGTTSGNYGLSISNLSANTTYHFRIVASNSGGTTNGNDLTFTTSAQPPPTVQTLAASSITTNSATLNLSVNPNGANTTVYFQYGLTASYGSTTFSLTGITTSQSYGISTTPTGPLSANTTYHFRAVAYNSGGTNYGSDLTFNTPPPSQQQPPTVTTLAATSVTTNSATLNLSVNPNGASTTVYFQYGLTASYGNMTFSLTGITTSQDYGISTTTTGPLSANTTYHFQAVAYNSGGTNSGSDLTFTTSSNEPTPTNNFYLLPQCINGFQVDVNGATDPGSSITNLVWNWGDGYQTSGGFPNTHTYSLAGQYILQVTAYNSDGSSDFILQTNNVGPGVLSGCYAWTINAEQGGSVSYQGSVASGTVPSGGSVTLQQAPEVGGPLTANPSPGYSFSGWSASSDIWFNFGSTNTLSVGAVVDGNGTITASFSALAPIVTTASASSVTANSATLNGSVNPNGLATTAYFQYGTSTNYNNTAPVSSLLNGTSTTGVSAPNVSGLAPNTTYHFRLVASSSAGTAYGADTNFTTLSGGTPAPVISSTYSTLTLTPSSQPADGSSQITATATLRDVNDSPVTNRTIQFTATGKATTKIANSTVTTDSSGKATTTITATTPGTSTICLIDPVNVNLITSATATFTQQGLVLPNANLASAISSFDISSESTLNGFSAALAPTVGSEGDYFWSAAHISGAQFASDIAVDGVDLETSSLKFSCPGTVALAMGETVIPGIAEGAVSEIDNLKTSNQSISCNADNLFDTGWINTMANGAVQTTAQAMLDRDQQMMAALWQQEQGEGAGQLLADPNSVLSGLYQDPTGLSDVASILPNCVSGNLEHYLSTQKTSLLNGIPPMSNAQQTAWANDLAARQGVPTVYYNIVWQNQQFLEEMQLENIQAENSWVGLRGADVAESVASAAAVALDCLGQDEAGIVESASIDSINTYVDNSRLNMFEKTYESAFDSVEKCFDYSGRIFLNEASSFAAIENGQWPQTVTATIGTPVHYSIGYLGGILNLLSQVEQESYSDIPIQNTSSTTAVFEIYALYTHSGDYFPGLGWPPLYLVATARASLDPGESETLRVFYTQEQQRPASPDAGSTVKNFVLGNNGSGTFAFPEIDTVWAANWLAESDIAIVSKTGATPQGKTPAIPQPHDDTNSVPTIPNPIAAYWTYSPSNQTYNLQLSIANPFNLPLTAVVTQAIPTNITISSTDGALDDSDSIITWTNILSPNTNITANFSFTCDTPYGSSFTLPAATLLLEDTNSGATLNAAGNVPQLVGLSTVQVNSLIPVGVLGIDSTMLVAVTNLTGTSQSGSLTVTLTDSSGISVMNFLESFSLDGSDGTNLSFTLPGSLSAGSYTLTGSLSVNGGTGQVLAGNYVVPAPPVALNLGSTPALTTNGLNVALQGPAGNYLIEASSDLSSSTNWQPILFYSSTNALFYYNFSVPMATNSNQQFYRAVMP